MKLSAKIQQEETRSRKYCYRIRFSLTFYSHDVDSFYRDQIIQELYFIIETLSLKML